VARRRRRAALQLIEIRSHVCDWRVTFEQPGPQSETLLALNARSFEAEHVHHPME
jgi:hypothetical protein